MFIMSRFKNIEIIGIPFLAGCLSGNVIAPHCPVWSHSLLFTATSAIAGYIYVRSRKSALRSIGIPLLCTLFFLCGNLCILRGYVCRFDEGAGFAGKAAEGFMAKKALFFSEAIDRTGFSDREVTATVKALLLGDRSGLSKSTIADFRLSGASHILALSGLHLGIIYGFISSVCRIFGNSITGRRIRSAFAVVFCWMYCLMVGSGASVSRAMIFILLREYAIHAGRSPDLRNILWASLLIHVCIAPSDFSGIGFQLSYLAIAGIAYVYPPLKKFYPEGGPKFSPVRKIWESASLSIACQATTFPLAFMKFGTTAPCFLLTNLICLPLTGVLIPFCIVLTLLSAAGVHIHFATSAAEGLVETMLFSLHAIAGI